MKLKFKKKHANHSKRKAHVYSSMLYEIKRDRVREMMKKNERIGANDGILFFLTMQTLLILKFKIYVFTNNNLTKKNLDKNRPEKE